MKDIEEAAELYCDNINSLFPGLGRREMKLVFQDGAQWQQTQSDLVSKWISCEERLPDEELAEDVLFYNSGYKLCFIGMLYDRAEMTFWDQSADTHTKVTHWQPLPQPPQI